MWRLVLELAASADDALLSANLRQPLFSLRQRRGNSRICRSQLVPASFQTGLELGTAAVRCGQISCPI
jgi:hypothetical protein